VFISYSCLNTHIDSGFLKPDIIGAAATVRFYIPDGGDRENQRTNGPG